MAWDAAIFSAFRALRPGGIEFIATVGGGLWIAADDGSKVQAVFDCDVSRWIRSLAAGALAVGIPKLEDPDESGVWGSHPRCEMIEFRGAVADWAAVFNAAEDEIAAAARKKIEAVRAGEARRDDWLAALAQAETANDFELAERIKLAIAGAEAEIAAATLEMNGGKYR